MIIIQISIKNFSRSICYNVQQYNVLFSIYSGAKYIDISPQDHLISLFTFNIALSLEQF